MTKGEKKKGETWGEKRGEKGSSSGKRSSSSVNFEELLVSSRPKGEPVDTVAAAAQVAAKMQARQTLKNAHESSLGS